MKILSVFDGMACGMLAMMGAGVKVDRYVAYEIDKYAIKAASHNFPQIEEKGDVFTADFTQYRGFDFLVGGSPCTYWSIAQSPDKRETTASGLGWELFCQYVRALKEAKPRFFIYENNKSMAKAIRDSIREAFGFEEICINSALVSAQNRQRFYWVGKYNPETDWYDKVAVDQPEDRGILLKDILDGVGAKDLSDGEMAYMVRATSNGRNHFDYGYIQISSKDKGACLTANVSKGVPYNVCCEPIALNPDSAGKGHCLAASRGGMSIGHDLTESRHNLVGVPVPFNPAENEKSYALTSSYYKISDTPISEFGEEKRRPRVAEPVRVGCMPSPDGVIKNGQANRIYSIDGKSVNLTANGGGAGAKTGLAAIPVSGDWNGDSKYLLKNQRNLDDKSVTLTAASCKGVGADGTTKVAIPIPSCVAQRDRYGNGTRSAKIDGGTEQFYEARNDGKTSTLTTVQKDNMVAEPCCMRYERTEEAKKCRRAYEAGEIHHGFHELSELHPRPDGKTNTLSTVLKDNPICEPVESATVLRSIPVIVEKKGYLPEMFNAYNRSEITDKAPTLSTGSMVTSSCAVNKLERIGPDDEFLCLADGEPMQVKEATKKGFAEIRQGGCVDIPEPNSKTRRGRNMSQKSNCLTTYPQYYQYIGRMKYAKPVEWDENGIPTRAISGADGKIYSVYCVKDGLITVKGKSYPIKLIDGYYIIRKLTVPECMRLQTVPEWYDFSCVSPTQAYKLLGNGWTVLVIVHLVHACLHSGEGVHNAP